MKAIVIAICDCFAVYWEFGDVMPRVVAEIGAGITNREQGVRSCSEAAKEVIGQYLVVL